jgi:hypothetical protein
MNALLIVLGIVIVILGYVLYLSYQTAPSVNLMDLGKDNSSKWLTTAKFPKVGSSTRYAYGVWIYANQLGQAGESANNTVFCTLKEGKTSLTGLPKYRVDDGNYTFVVYFDSNKPILHCGIKTQAKDSGKVSENSCPLGPGTCTDTFDVIITDNFTLQRWVYLVISVDNLFVDLYLDGKLVKSVKMVNLPYQDNLNIVSVNISEADAKKKASTVFGYLPGFMLAKFQRWETPLDPQSVWNYYMQGNGQGGSGSKYKVNLDFVKDNKLTTQWNLM